MRFAILAALTLAACIDQPTATAPTPDRADLSAARAGEACSTCDGFVSVVFAEPQIGECMVEGSGFIVDGPAVADAANPKMTWVADVQGRPNPLYPDLNEDGVIVRHGVLGDCEWLRCIIKR